MDRLTELAPALWPASRAGEAVGELARRMGMLAVAPATSLDSAVMSPDGIDLGRAIDLHARRHGMEAEPVSARIDEMVSLLSRGGPALLKVPAEPARLLALLPGRSGRVRLLARDGRVHLIAAERLRDLVQEKVTSTDGGVEHVLGLSGVPSRARAHARDILSRRARPREFDIESTWLLRLPPGAPVARHARAAGIVRDISRLGAAHAVQYAVWIAAWALLGRAAFGRGGEPGVLAAWALLLLVLTVLRAWIDRTAGRLSIEGGAWLKRRLLAGALQLRPEEIRHQGAGHLLGRVSESEALETLGLGGGLLAGVAAVELLLAGAVLFAGAGGALSVAVLVTAIVAMLAVSLRFRHLQAAWTNTRLWMSGTIVENMVGRRTFIAQMPSARWHEGEDERVAAYERASRAMDKVGGLLIAGIPRAQLFAGVGALMPAFVAGASGTSLAIGLGGTLLAHQALLRITSAIAQLTGAAVAWAEAGPLFASAARSAEPSGAMAAVDRSASSNRLIAAEGLTYRHEGRGEPTLRGASLTIERGDRIILEGTSGAGKSTLAAILGGLRQPHAGLLLIGGLDRHSLDASAWRRRVVVVPQFHENHVFSGTLAFNLLLGRRWPPRQEDLDAAESICRELGLGPLLDRMPSGMQQTVGESGWQLSHGERSRLFVARALLQQPDVLVMDESLAALDAETAGQVMDCVTNRVSAVMAIAHQ